MVSIPRKRTKDVNWAINGTEYTDGSLTVEGGGAKLAVALDLRDALHEIRDELRSLNQLMHCSNVIKGFRALQRLDKRLAKKVPLR